jgi:hypothetical protein
MRFVTWLRSLAPRPASPRPRPAARPRAAFRPRLEALEDRQLLNASTAFDAFGNPLRLVVDNAGQLTETYLGQTAPLATGVLRAHAYRDSDGGIGITVVYQNESAYDYDHTGGHYLGQNIIDVDKAFDRAGHIQEDVTYSSPAGYATFEYTSTAAYQVPQQGFTALLIHPFQDSLGNLGEDATYFDSGSTRSTLIEYDSGGAHYLARNAVADRAYGQQFAIDVVYTAFSPTGFSTEAVEYTDTKVTDLGHSAAHDVLYVGDNVDTSGDHSAVKAFDPSTGAALGTPVAPGAGGLHGVMGLIVRNPGQLLVVNQNVNLPIPGEVLRYNGRTSDPLPAVVSHTDPHAPFAPRGMVLKDNVLYVASYTDGDTTPAGLTPDGEIDKYDATTGQFLGAFGRPAGWAGQFNPRGVVFGPDGNLYASVYDSSDPVKGYVLKIDVGTGGETVFASEGGAAPDLHRPEGLTFGPDGKLYVTGFRADTSDTDKIVVLDPSSGAEVKSIALDAVGQPRAFAEEILFAPGGRLFAPISGNGPDTGAVRSYDVSDGSFVNFEPAGTLGFPWYLTFGQTDPATLAYGRPDVSAELVTPY